jgi:preprotein translocase subunit SecE
MMAKAVAVINDQSEGLQRLKSQPERLRDFLKDVRAEMRKVITPSRVQVQATTTVVLVTVFLFAAYFWVIDTLIGNVIETLLHKFSLH